jgi:allophanate hydrolase
MHDQPFDIAALRRAYATGAMTPSAVVDLILARVAARGEDHVWIDPPDAAALHATARRLEQEGANSRPLWGVPFAIKDNIDLAGRPTTAACPAFAYTPAESAACVARLVAAGAIPVGKTNLDQFATGLNGTRSPYGTGGSSSGSAVAVAAGLASFALGTDTAGSGRVPAAFNDLIGLKPTRGLISTRGVVPACRSLDCVSIFALTAHDALTVLDVAAGFDPADPFSRRAPPAAAATAPRSLAGCRLGVPRSGQLQFFGNAYGPDCFAAALRRAERLGAAVEEIDFAPFQDAARLLYEGPWLAERYLAIRDFFDRHPEALHPVTHAVIAGGVRPSAADAFAGAYRLEALRQAIAPLWQQIDALVTPTAGRQYTIAELLEDPLEPNNALGTYTNFVNLLDLSAVAVPAGRQGDSLGFGITLVAPAWHDAALCALADALHRDGNTTMGALGHRLALTPRLAPQPADAVVRIAVCGAHMQGLPLNHQLTGRGARLVRACRTAPRYRLFALPGGPPARPGMLRDDSGAAIAVEVWEVPLSGFGGFVADIPPPLGIGSITLEDGEVVKGFLCEPYATAGARDITVLGGWRAWLAAAPCSSPSTPAAPDV